MIEERRSAPFRWKDGSTRISISRYEPGKRPKFVRFETVAPAPPKPPKPAPAATPAPSGESGAAPARGLSTWAQAGIGALLALVAGGGFLWWRSRQSSES